MNTQSARRITNTPGAIGTREVQPEPAQESFVGEGIVPECQSFCTSGMATGKPGLPLSFSWRGKRFSIVEVLEEWKDCGDCRHGSGERYIRKHWFRVRTTEAQEMRIYFERQGRSSGGSRWRLYSIRGPERTAAPMEKSVMCSGG